jgi:hypothetical protein
MSQENRRSFKIVAACSVALIAIAATCGFCVGSATNQPKVFRTKPNTKGWKTEIIKGTKREEGYKPQFSISDKKAQAELTLYGDCLAQLLREYDHIIRNAGKEFSPTILRSVKVIEISPDQTDPNRINVTMLLPIKKMDIYESLNKVKEYQPRPQPFTTGPWPEIIIKESPSEMAKEYKDGFVSFGMRAVSFGVFNNNILGKEFLSPGCLADIIVEQKLSKSGINSSTTSTTLFRKIQILDVSSRPEYPKSTLIRASLTEQQAEILMHGVMNGSISLRALEPLKKLPPSDSPKNLLPKPLPEKPSLEP